MADCMICDLYAVIDRHENPRSTSSYGADLATVLPPRGHGFHNLTLQQRYYRTPPSLFQNVDVNG